MSFCLTRLAKQSHANYAYHFLCRNEWLTYLLNELSSQCFTLLGPFSALQQSFFFLKGFTAAAADTATAVVAVITTALTLTGCGASLNSCHVLMNKDGPISGRFDSKWRQK